MDDICHIIMPHHVLNDYGCKRLVHYDLSVMILGLLVILVLYDWNIIHKFSHIFDDIY